MRRRVHQDDSSRNKLMLAWSQLAVAAGARWQTLLWISLWLVGVPLGLMSFLSVLFWVYGVDG